MREKRQNFEKNADLIEHDFHLKLAKLPEWVAFCKCGVGGGSNSTNQNGLHVDGAKQILLIQMNDVH